MDEWNLDPYEVIEKLQTGPLLEYSLNGKALDWYSRECRFDSYYSNQILRGRAVVAQRAHNP